MSVKRLEFKEISRDFEVRLISRLMRKRLLLFSTVLLFQASIILIILFLLWHCRTKNEYSAELQTVNPVVNRVEIRFTGNDRNFLSPGERITLKNFSAEARSASLQATIQAVRTSDDNRLLLSLALDEKSTDAQQKDLCRLLFQQTIGTNITLEARTERLIHLLFSGKEMKGMPTGRI